MEGRAWEKVEKVRRGTLICSFCFLYVLSDIPVYAVDWVRQSAKRERSEEDKSLEWRRAVALYSLTRGAAIQPPELLPHCLLVTLLAVKSLLQSARPFDQTSEC